MYHTHTYMDRSQGELLEHRENIQNGTGMMSGILKQNEDQKLQACCDSITMTKRGAAQNICGCNKKKYSDRRRARERKERTAERGGGALGYHYKAQG